MLREIFMDYCRVGFSRPNNMIDNHTFYLTIITTWSAKANPTYKSYLKVFLLYHLPNNRLGELVAIQKTSKEKILQESAKLFKIKGYYNTTMSDIANACGLLKGSIYHHFKSKDDIGLETLKYIHSYFDEDIFKIAYQKNMTPYKQIKLFVKKTDHYFLNSEGGCLLGNLALEVSWSNLDFKNEIKEYFLNWEKALSAIFQNKFNEIESKELAKEYVALIQGEIMMMNLHNDKERYLRVGKKMIELFE